MSDERGEFSKRLASAMRAAGWEPRPGVLLKHFNSTYHGRSVSFQTASRWLNGESLPAQEKLQVLAKLYGVAPEELRFGSTRARRVADARTDWPTDMAEVDRTMLQSYLGLGTVQRRLVRELVDALAGKLPSK
ncbi:helix-turn-helix transcriptional regulator [Lysobacter sp. N42]|uniref:helix-turn-helix domain-containing protein n=1 Tax=Lysobacter sp. N42 TaxID=2545719 RepID=UPI00104B153D|nr:helix-turn-helix transcriptional regulator [Lysobacter sp. N42]TCZ84254.1 helix-turn-helix domain-containing protein [Lysobacter sp. N42]